MNEEKSNICKSCPYAIWQKGTYKKSGTEQSEVTFTFGYCSKLHKEIYNGGYPLSQLPFSFNVTNCTLYDDYKRGLENENDSKDN